MDTYQSIRDYRYKMIRRAKRRMLFDKIKQAVIEMATVSFMAVFIVAYFVG